MGKNKENFDFDSGSLIFYVFKKFKTLFIVSFAAAILSTIISFFITPKFESSVVMFPTAGVSVSKSLLADGYNPMKGSLMNFGEEEEAEQLLQILNSEELRGRVIQKFDLMNHYEIKLNSKYPYTTLINEFKSNFKFRRTEFLSVVIEVRDKDPKKAAEMANYSAALIDTIMNNMQKQRAKQAFDLVKKEYVYLKETITQIEDSITKLSKLGVNDFQSQAKAYNEAYAKAILDGKTKVSEIFQNKLNLLSKYGSTNVALIRLIRHEAEQLSILESKYAIARLEADQNLSHFYIVDSAQPAEKKAYPKRIIIMLVSTVSAFILTLITLIVVDNIKKYLK
jgi:uncharacterized protein involved in exopolysaccharide biosynthesis